MGVACAINFYLNKKKKKDFTLMENAQVLKDSFCTIFAAEKKKDATKVVSQNQTHPSTSTRYSMC